MCGSIEDLTLDKFVKFLEKKDYTQLVITGTPPQDALEETALQILSQYQAAINNVHSKHHKRLTEDIQSMATRIDRITMLFEALKTGYSLPIIEELRLDDIDYPFTEKSLAADLVKVETRIKSDLVKLNVKRKQMEDIEAQFEGKKVNRQDYIRHLQLAGKMDGVHYKIKEVTVEEYCSLINRLMEYSKANQK